MENSSERASRCDGRHARAVNVGDTERTISAVAGGFLLLYGLSRLSLSTIVAAVTGGALLYRGLTGHCSAYQALDMSTSCGLENDEGGGRRMRPRHEVTDESLAATGESPPIAAR
jgi:uncharacterized membrane protein